MGLFFKHTMIKPSRFNNLKLQENDRSLLIFGNNNLSYTTLYCLLRDKYEDKFGKAFFSDEDYKNKNGFHWYTIEEKIFALTQIMAFMFSDHVSRVGSLSHNGKKDKTLSTIIAYPKKKISISKAALAAYPSIKDDVKELKKIFKKTRHSLEFGEKKGAIVKKLRNLATSKREVRITIVESIDTLRNSVGLVSLIQNTKNKNHYDIELKRRVELFHNTESTSTFKDSELKKVIATDQSIDDFKHLQFVDSYELNLKVYDLITEASKFIEKQLNLKIKKRLTYIEKLIFKTIDIFEYHELGNHKIVDFYTNGTNSFKKLEPLLKKKLGTSDIPILSVPTNLNSRSLITPRI